MRVIAGRLKGIKLKMVPGNHVRPTSDRVKESIFQVLGPYFNGGTVLDLFAGSGQLGLEALSRGVDYVVFVDRSPKSIHTIKQNIALTKMESNTRVIKQDTLSACRILGKKALQFDYIFVDPPYHRDLLLPVLQEISTQQLLSSNGRVIVERENTNQIPIEIGRLKKEMERPYGSTSIDIYQAIFLGSKEESS